MRRTERSAKPCAPPVMRKETAHERDALSCADADRQSVRYSERCREVLAQADFIAAEDTRVTLRLLNHLELKKPLVSYYEHNKGGKRPAPSSSAFWRARRARSCRTPVPRPSPTPARIWSACARGRA